MTDDGLQPLITECPTCATRFRVTESQLHVAGGKVRCGACLAVFQGVDHLYWGDEDQTADAQGQPAPDESLDAVLEELERPQPPADESVHESELEEISDAPVTKDAIAAAVAATFANLNADKPISEPADDETKKPMKPAVEAVENIELPGVSWQNALPPEAPTAQEAPTTQDTQGLEDSQAQPDAAQVRGAGTPSVNIAAVTVQEIGELASDEADFEFHKSESSNQRRWVPFAAALSVVALIGQVLWYQFDNWSTSPSMRPMYGVICAVLPCELPVLTDVAKVYSKNLLVRSHPEVTNALVVDAIIVNQAEFDQPFPHIQLTFTSIKAKVVASRQFSPEEYLRGELEGAKAMPSMTPVHISLAIEDPGSDAVNYTMTFR